MEYFVVFGLGYLACEYKAELREFWNNTLFPKIKKVWSELVMDEQPSVEENKKEKE